MANTPTFASWRNNTNSVTNPGSGATVFPPCDISFRQLAALAAYISGQNPDGTTKGT